MQGQNSKGPAILNACMLRLIGLHISWRVVVSAHDTGSICAAEGVLDGESWGLSVRQFMHLSPHEQVLLLVPQDCTASDVAAATAARVAKLTAAAVPSEDRQQLLVGLVQEDAPRHLPWCVHIFERLRLQRQVRVSPHPQAPPFLCPCQRPFLCLPKRSLE